MKSAPMPAPEMNDVNLDQIVADVMKTEMPKVGRKDDIDGLLKLDQMGTMQ